MSGSRRLAAEFEESRLEDELEEGRDEITKLVANIHLTRPKCPHSGGVGGRSQNVSYISTLFLLLFFFSFQMVCKKYHKDDFKLLKLFNSLLRSWDTAMWKVWLTYWSRYSTQLKIWCFSILFNAMIGSYVNTITHISLTVGEISAKRPQPRAAPTRSGNCTGR